MTTVAAIDCGTNSIRLLVAEGELVQDGRPGLRDLTRRMEIVRLGQGVDRTGELAPEALERTFAACRDYAAEIERLGATRVRFVATSATRDASNRADFVVGVRDILGVEPEVVSGEQEAALSFRGATGELAGLGVPEPYLVVDIGGGSTEFVLGASEPLAARSVDIGCVRMTERHLRSDPPAVDEVSAATADIDAAIARAGETVPLAQARSLVGLAGSVTTVAAHALGLDRYDADVIHLARLPRDRALAACQDLLHLTREQRAALPFMHPGRVDVIGAGALVLHQILLAVDVPELVVSEHDILDGIALGLL
ncbi:MAG: Ppx/GppA phosphatase family protein [Actinomycetes bacterium]